jgi:hypothetical protein
MTDSGRGDDARRGYLAGPPFAEAYTGGTRPWTVCVADSLHAGLEEAVAAVAAETRA